MRGGFVPRFAGDHGLCIIPRGGVSGGGQAVGDFPGLVIATQRLETKKGPKIGQSIAGVLAGDLLENLQGFFIVAGNKLDMTEVESGGRVIRIRGQDRREEIAGLVVTFKLSQNAPRVFKTLRSCPEAPCKVARRSSAAW